MPNPKARAIYTGLFERLISLLNAHMAVLGGGEVDDESERFVGVLDVFGFENFESNGFEQALTAPCSPSP